MRRWRCTLRHPDRHSGGRRPAPDARVGL